MTRLLKDQLEGIIQLVGGRRGLVSAASRYVIEVLIPLPIDNGMFA